MLLKKFVGVVGGAALVLGSALVTAPSAEAATLQRTVCGTSQVNVRAKATTASAKVGTIKRWTRISGTKVGSWLKLADGRYVSYRYTCVAPPFTTRAASTVSRSIARPAIKAVSAIAAPTGKYPFVQPTGVTRSPSSLFGMRLHPIYRVWKLHNGIDLGNRAGAPIVAAAAGKVTRSGWGGGGSGINVRIAHSGGLATSYLHMSRTVVRAGQTVKAGQIIGYVGSTGAATGPHLHFSVTKNGSYVNPLLYIGPASSLRP